MGRMVVKNKYGSCEYEFEHDYVHIFNLNVKKRFRRQGHATGLLKTAIREIKETGYIGEISIVAQHDYLKTLYSRLKLKVYSFYG